MINLNPLTSGIEFNPELSRIGAPVNVGQRMRGATLLTQTLSISIPRDLKVEIVVRGDELKKEDLTKIKSQFYRWIEGLEEAFE